MRILILGLACCAILCLTASAQPQMYDFVTIAGHAGSRGRADGTNSAARFYLPSAIVVDPAGNLFVADNASGDGTDTIGTTIRKLTRVGTNWVTGTIAGAMGSWGSADGTNREALFYGVFGISVDTGGNVFVADAGNATIRKLRPVGTNWVTSTIAGLAGSPGSIDGTNSDARFSDPRTVAVDENDNIYVADFQSYTIRKVALIGTNWVTTTIAGQAGIGGLQDGAGSNARFDGPIQVALDHTGNIYVNDLIPVGNTGGVPLIRKLTSLGANWIVNTPPWGGAASDWGEGIAVDYLNNVYIAERFTIRKLVLSANNWGWSTLGGTNGAARFSYPNGIAVDDIGNIYVADTENNTIRMGVPVGVAPPPILQNLVQTDGGTAFTWTAIPDLAYQLQYTSDLHSSNWVNAGPSITATNGMISASNVVGPDSHRFYRVVLLP
jgi:hypothetical protein